MKKAYPEPSKCAVCKCILRKEMVSWHHPRGRIKARLLCFVPLCQRCHDRIHDNGKIARDFGYIQPEHSGGKADANTPNPFGLPPE
jgi:hypothetical protein